MGRGDYIKPELTDHGSVASLAVARMTARAERASGHS